MLDLKLLNADYKGTWVKVPREVPLTVLTSEYLHTPLASAAVALPEDGRILHLGPTDLIGIPITNTITLDRPTTMSSGQLTNEMLGVYDADSVELKDVSLVELNDAGAVYIRSVD